MSRKLIECVLNFSEGRDRNIVDEVTAAAHSVPGVALLHRHIDADHNRSVLTFAGDPSAVGAAAIAAVGKATELIDLNRQSGVHPRIGSADVVPFVPLDGATMEDCVRTAHEVGQAIWRRFQVPVYFYDHAALHPDRVDLAHLRRGQFERLREQVLASADRQPDVGGPALHPTAGAVAVGARKLLIAYNINLDTADLGYAQRIAKAIRASSGGLPTIKALGVFLASQNRAQVTINLTDYEQVSLHEVYEAVRKEARRLRVNIAGSEIVGLVPRRALERAGVYFVRCENFGQHLVLEDRVTEMLPQAEIDDYLESMAAPAPTPGGGSAAAIAAAMSAALGHKVSSLARIPVRRSEADEPYDFEADRRFFVSVEKRDCVAYAAVAAVHGNDPEALFARDRALHEAAVVPMELAERAKKLLAALNLLAQQAPARLVSDVSTAIALAVAAQAGALATVRANLPSIGEPKLRTALEARAGALE